MKYAAKRVTCNPSVRWCARLSAAATDGSADELMNMKFRDLNYVRLHAIMPFGNVWGMFQIYEI